MRPQLPLAAEHPEAAAGFVYLPVRIRPAVRVYERVESAEQRHAPVRAQADEHVTVRSHQLGAFLSLGGGEALVTYGRANPASRRRPLSPGGFVIVGGGQVLSKGEERFGFGRRGGEPRESAERIRVELGNVVFAALGYFGRRAEAECGGVEINRDVRLRL